MKYVVGNLIHIKDDDPSFDELQTAVDAAIEKSREDEYAAFGVWIAEDGDLLGIAHLGEWFSKVW